MKNILLFTAITLFSLITVQAQTVEFNLAKQKAQAFFFVNEDTENILKSATEVEVDSCTTFFVKRGLEKSGKTENEPALYVINRKDKPGFIIFSADYRTKAILGYSLTGTFSNENMPPALLGLLDDYIQQIEYVKENLPEEYYPESSGWVKSLKLQTVLESSYLVAPLLGSINFDQGSGWNKYCPLNLLGPNFKAYVGCTAVAMAQLMKYWEWPNQGQGKHTNKNNPLQTINFSEAYYNWNMSNNTPDDYNALLLYHCGVSIDMDYDSNDAIFKTSSGAPLENVIPSLEEFFKYKKSTATFLEKGENSEDWISMLTTELIYDRPILYRGIKIGAHAFIIDGMTHDKKFHINWGWNGNCNGEYSLDNLIPEGQSYDFSDRQAASKGIIPDKNFINLKIYPQSQTLSSYSIQAGKTANASCIVLNSGNITAGTHVVSIHISKDKELTPNYNGDRYIDEINITSIAPFTQIKTEPKSIKIPGDLEDGVYFIYFSVDGGERIAEKIESDNQEYVQITVTAASNPNTPTLSTPSPSSLAFGNVTVNTNSSPKSFSISGSNLTGNVSVSVSGTGYTISKSPSSGFGTSELSFSPSGGTLSNQTVYVRFSPTSTGSKPESITVSSSGASSKTVSLSGTGTIVATPTLTVSDPSLSFGNVTVSTNSTKSFTISGSNLTGSVALAVSGTAYQISKSQSSGFTSSLSFSPSGGTLSNQTVYVRFSPSSTGDKTETIFIESSNAGSKTVSLSGTGVSGGSGLSNDNSCSPQPLTIRTSCDYEPFTTVNATPPATDIIFYGSATCTSKYQATRYDDDVWFHIQPETSSEVTITVEPTSNLGNFDIVLGLYSGNNCITTSQITCGAKGNAGEPETITFTPQANTGYLIRVFSYGEGSSYSGDFDICVTSDDGVEEEEGEDDFYIENATVSSTTIMAGAKADVTCFQCYSGIKTDSELSSCRVGYYLSTNTTFSNDDIYLDDDLSSLGEDDPCNEETAELTIPGTIEEGIYYILFIADYDNAFSESNEKNNVLYKKITIKSGSNDFYIQNALVTPTLVAPGGQIDVDCEQFYSGLIPDADLGNCYIGYYLSANSSFSSSSDIFLDEDNSGLGSDDISDPESATLTIPLGTKPGNYYILFVSDYKNEYSEVDEDNNVVFVQITVTDGSDDFFIHNAMATSTTVSSGSTIDVECQQCYSGSKTDEIMDNSYVGYYLSSNTIFDKSTDTPLGTDVSSLGNDDACNTESATLTVPSGLSSGIYYILFVADYDGQFTESNENNNVEFVQITVIGVQTPSISVSETALDFGYTLINTNSSPQSFTVSGSNLKGDISLSAPTGFEISKSLGSGYQSSLNLTQSGGTVSNTTIYVRFKPTTTGSKSGNISITSTDVETKNVAVSGTGTTVATPSIMISTFSLPDFGSVVVNTTSSPQSFTVSGSNLKADISLSAPTGFEISKSTGSGYGSSLNLAQSGGTVSSTMIYVRFKPTTTGTKTGNIAITSTGAETKNVAVSGTGTTVATPSIMVSTNTLSDFGNVVVNTASAAQSFTVSGSNLKGDISLSAPTGFEISKSTGSGYGSSLNLAQSGGTVSSTMIYVRFKPTTTGTKTGNIAITSTGAETKNVAVSGTGTTVATPSIMVSTNTLSDFGNVVVNTASAAQSFTVSGSNLKADISLSAPTGFEISKSLGSGYQSSLNLTQSGGTVSNTTIYVRFKPTTTGTKSGNISITSTDAETKNVAVSGTGKEICTPPVSPTSATASQTTITSGQSTTLQVNGGALNSASNWVWYTGSCGGSQVGTGTSLSVSPTSTTTYYVQASACGNTTLCKSVTITVLPSSGCNPPASQSGIIFSDVVANAITINTTGGNGNRRIIMINTVNSFTIPEIGTEPSANSIYSGSGEQVVYFGAANNVTVTGLRSGVRYWVRVFEANCKGESTVYNANTLEDNPSSISTICNSPVSPLKAEANPVNIFSGETTTLQVIGGSLNAAPDWEWYSGSCNGVLVGKGASISVSPATTTTYFVHASACGVNTICREVTVTVNDENSVIDADGNVYSIVTIGNQTWLGQNLKTTKYNDGTSIPLVTNNNTWSNLSGPAYCWYNNDISYKNPFGALYNWYAVNSGKLCPKGWHVPSDEEWTALINYLGGAYIAGGKLKEVGLQYWISPNQDAINSTGFSGLPGGFRSSFDGKFSNFSSSGDWWSSTQENSIYAWGRSIWNSSGQIYRYSDVDKKSGASVRCICDSPVGNKDLSVNDFIKIYPNPASKEIFIESSNYSGQNCTVEIWSMDGKKVITRGNMDLTHKQTLKTSELTSGFYFLRIYSDEINFNQKIVIKQE